MKAINTSIVFFFNNVGHKTPGSGDNYHTSLTRVVQFICKACCYKTDDIKKNKHVMP